MISDFFFLQASVLIFLMIQLTATILTNKLIQGILLHGAVAQMAPNIPEFYFSLFFFFFQNS